MRIKLKKGKQKELIVLAKNNKTWKQLSELSNHKPEYIRIDLKSENRLISEELYHTLCNSVGKNFDKYIEKKLKDNWGQSKGGQISKGKTITDISFPKYSKKLAELYGVMLGDGNSNRTKGYKIGTYMIRIIGDSNLDKEYHINYLKPLMENLFKIEVKVGKYKSNAIHLTIHSKLIVEFFEKIGFPPGNKIKNNLPIPSWIKSDKDYLCACLRGIYDTDGGIYNLNNQNTHQIAFTNHNYVLLNDVRNSLLSLGICPSKIINNRRIYLTKKSELIKFLNLIGFRNPRHSKKVKMFNIKAP